MMRRNLLPLTNADKRSTWSSDLTSIPVAPKPRPDANFLPLLQADRQLRGQAPPEKPGLGVGPKNIHSLSFLELSL